MADVAENSPVLPSSAKEAIAIGEKFYFTGKLCKHGHLSKRRATTGVCMTCKKEEGVSRNNKDRRKRWRLANREKYREKKRAEYRKNIEKERERDRLRYQKNRLKKIQYQRSYVIKNRDNVLASKREYHHRKMNQCPVYAAGRRVRSLVYISLESKKSLSTEAIIGCSLDAFKSHIEKQFTKGMSWGNRAEWHIDHIIPISSAKTEEEIIALNHYTNLRPLWAKDNLSKGAKMEFLI